jgi:hypothetical protein
MPRPEWRDAEKEKYWRRLLGQWRRSGLTGRDFCAENSVSEASFYAWKREIARRDQEVQARTRAATPAALLPAFVPVTIESVPTTAAAPVEVVLAGGRVLRVRGGFDAAVLRQLLALLEELSC